MTDLVLIEEPMLFSLPPGNSIFTSQNAISTDFVIGTDFAIVEDTAIFNTANQSMLLSLNAGNGIEDAPHDSTLYGRNNGVWVQVPDYGTAPDVTNQLTLLTNFRQTALGLTTANEDRYISIHDLLDMGMIRRTHTGFDYLVPNVDIVSVGPRVLETPPQPKNLKVVGGFGHIQLFWEPAKLEYTNHYVTQIWRSTSMLRASANLIASVPLSYHYVDTSALLNNTYYYWIRFVNDEANHGPYTESVSYGVAKIPPEVVKNSLIGEVDSSLLAEELLTPITSILAPGGIADTLVELDYDIIQSTQIAADGLIAEAEARAVDLINEALARGNDIASVTELVETTEQSLLSKMDLMASVFGSPFDAAKVWQFDTTDEGWTSTGGAVVAAGSKLTPFYDAVTTDAISPLFAIEGSDYGIVRVALKKIGSPTWVGKVYYTTTFSPTFTEGMTLTIPEPTFFGGLGTAIWDMASSGDWDISVVTKLRIILAGPTTLADHYDVDWVEVGKEVDGNSVAALLDEVTLVTAANEALATELHDLAAQVRGEYTGTDIAFVNQGLLSETTKLILKGDTALGTKMDILKVGLREVEDAAGDLDGAIGNWKQLAQHVEFVQVQSSFNNVTANSLTSLETQLGENTASIEEVNVTLSTDLLSLAESVTTLSADVGDVAASVTIEAIARANAISAEAAQRVVLATQVNGVAASVVTEQAARSSGDAAEAAQRVILRADFESEKLETNSKISGAILIEREITATALGVVASATETVAGRVGDTEAAIEDMSEVVLDITGKIEATRTIKVNVNTAGKFYAAGMGITITNSSGIVQSEIAFVADTFRIMQDIDGTLTQPFYVDSGNVYINTAFIKNASITAAQIANATITNAQIANATISFAKIADDIQSTDYSIGVDGWRIAKGGLAEFNDIYARGDIQASSLKANTAMVDTLNVNNGAVTSMYFASGGSASIAKDAFATVVSIVTTMPSGSSGLVISVVVGAKGDSNLEWSSMEIAILKDGVYLQNQYYTCPEQDRRSYSLQAFDASPAGSHTYALRLGASNKSITYYYPSMTIVGGKR